jgi:hypothetical protein
MGGPGCSVNADGSAAMMMPDGSTVDAATMMAYMQMQAAQQQAMQQAYQQRLQAAQQQKLKTDAARAERRNQDQAKKDAAKAARLAKQK